MTDDEFIEILGIKDISVARLLSTLSDRESRILKMRFGLCGNHPMTLREIGSRLGLTGGRVWQIEAKALYKLRHPTRIQMLRNVLHYEVMETGDAK